MVQRRAVYTRSFVTARISVYIHPERAGTGRAHGAERAPVRSVNILTMEISRPRGRHVVKGKGETNGVCPPFKILNLRRRK